MSPALNDGAAGAASLWPRLLTTGPHAELADSLPTEPSLGPAPSARGAHDRLVTEIVENHITGMWLIAETVSGVLRAVRGRLCGTGEPGRRPGGVVDQRARAAHIFNEPLTQRRAVAFASIPLTDAETVTNAFGGSAANVFLAACTLSLRAWLEHHDRCPRIRY